MTTVARALPEFLCIGTQKAGTSWLFEQLRQHPEIWLPPIKELHYFDHLYCTANRKWTKWHIEESARRIIKNQASQKRMDLTYIKYITSLATGDMFNERWYADVFVRPAARGKLLGDVTPEYCTIDAAGVKYVDRFLRHPKLIWLIRDPLQRALSQLRMNVSRLNIPGDISEAAWWDAARDGSILNRGNLSRYVPEWEAVFGGGEILYIPYRHISADPSGLLRRVEAYLGVKEFANYISPETVIHPTPKLDVPEPVIQYLAETLVPETEFLRSRFGTEFCEQI